MDMYTYTDKELLREAKLAIKDKAKATRARASYVGYEIRFKTHDCPRSLVAHGKWSDTGDPFSVAVAI